MSGKTEVTEVQVLTEEQINALPEVVRTNVKYLSENVGVKDLSVLNPIATELIEIRQLGSELQLMPLNDKGEFNKDNVQQFVDLKKKIRSFRSGLKSDIKDLKAPYVKINKGYISIEKAIIDEATKVYESAEETFATYITEQDKIAAERQAKKDKALQEALAEENKGKVEAQDALAKSTLYNKIKYEIINKNTTEASANAVANSNRDIVSGLESDINNYTFDTIIGDNDVSILDENVVAELKEYFITSKNNAVKILVDKIKALDIETKNIQLEAQKTTIASPIEVEVENVIPNPPIPRFETLEQCINQIEFVGYISIDGHKLENNAAWIKIKKLAKK